jgi:hypothetical protein
MTRPYVTEVESNIQGGVKAKLGPKTLIVGPNRVGKSSIVRAIELATTGRASDVAGRDTLAMDAELFSLAPADAGRERRGSLRTTLTRRGRSRKKSKRIGSAAIFPLRDVRSAILGSAETARKFFLSVASRLSWEAVLAELPPQFHARLSPYKSADGAAGLLAAIEGTKKRVRELNAQAKAQRAHASATSQGLPPPPSAAEVAAAKAAGENAARASQVAQARARLASVERETTRSVNTSRTRASDRVVHRRPMRFLRRCRPSSSTRSRSASTPLRTTSMTAPCWLSGKRGVRRSRPPREVARCYRDGDRDEAARARRRASRGGRRARRLDG